MAFIEVAEIKYYLSDKTILTSPTSMELGLYGSICEGAHGKHLWCCLRWVEALSITWISLYGID